VLFEQARARGLSPSRLVRDALGDALDSPRRQAFGRDAAGATLRAADRVRLTMRMSRAEEAATLDAACRAGLTPGAFVAGLVADVPCCPPVPTALITSRHLSHPVASSRH